MTKKQNTWLFIAIATICNVLLTLILLVIFTVLGGLILKENLGIALPFLFIAALIAGFFIYQKLTAWIVAKFKLEEKLQPLFGSKYRKKRLD